MEVLSDILRSMRVEGSVYFCDHLQAPWTLPFNQTKAASFHMVRRGECWLEAGERVDRLGPGDLVFVEPGRDHTLSSNPPGDRSEERFPSEARETLLLCGYCDFTRDVDSPLGAVFPSLTIVRDEELIRTRGSRGRWIS